MLPKIYRLPVQSVLKNKGKTFRTLYFLVRVYLPPYEYSRFAAVVSRKTSPKAVVRNRLKRIVYDFCRAERDKLPAADYLISVLPPAASLPKPEFMKELEKALNQL